MDSAGTDGTSGTQQETARPSGEPPAPDVERTFDWRGWLLVATIAVCFLLIPGVIVLLPSAQAFVSSFGVSLRDAYLTLPMIPAILLGAIAVWSAVRSRSA